MKKQLAVLLTSLIVGGSMLFVLPSIRAQQSTNRAAAAPANPRGSGHPLLGSTLHELELARTNLANMKSDFGGHRAAALKACDEAIKEVNAALKYAEEHH